VYEYDDQGRVARTVARSSWTDEDRALMLAYAEYKASLCPGCGHPKETAWHPLVDSYEVTASYTCCACTARARHGSDPGTVPPVEYTVVTDTMPDVMPAMSLAEAMAMQQNGPVTSPSVPSTPEEAGL
jgi:hypothetical protein